MPQRLPGLGCQQVDSPILTSNIEAFFIVLLYCSVLRGRAKKVDAVRLASFKSPANAHVESKLLFPRVGHVAR